MVGVFGAFVRIGQVEATVYVVVALEIALSGNMGIDFRGSWTLGAGGADSFPALLWHAKQAQQTPATAGSV